MKQQMTLQAKRLFLQFYQEQEQLNQEEAQPIQLASHQPAQVLRVVFLLTKQIQI